MTLNITLATDRFICQSSDCRLVVMGKNPIPLQDSFPKPVFAQYQDLKAVIGYAGIGRIGSTQTSTWLSEVLGRNPQRNMDLDSLLETVRRDASRWLRQVRRDDRRHSFVVGAFTSAPALAIVSNWEHISGRQERVANSEFWIERTEVTAKGQLLVVGLRGAVERSDRQRLRRRMHDGASQENVLTSLTDANRRAALNAPKYVSSESLVYTLFPDGRSALKVDGPVNGDFNPILLQWGRNLTEMTIQMIQDKLASGEWAQTGPIQVVQGVGATMTSGTDKVAEGPD